MQKVLPNACYIGFTGTPLKKKDKNTAAKFGGVIDAYRSMRPSGQGRRAAALRRPARLQEVDQTQN